MSSYKLVIKHWTRACYRCYYMLISCYRLDYRSSYDEELVWSLVQRHGGLISVRGDCIDFWIESQWELVLNLAFPDLIRLQDLDIIR